MTEIVTDQAVIDRAVAAIRECGMFAMDVEFVSKDRYVPDLALVQLAWGNEDDPEIALADALAVDLSDVAQLLSDPKVTVIVHAGRQDLQLMHRKFGVRATSVVDTQIAAAFCGVGEQIGYGKLVAHIVGETLDKGPQFTNWLRRPLTDKQLHYAAGDVVWLARVWRELTIRLGDRISWVLEESEALCKIAATRVAPEEFYLGVSGAGGLRPDSLGALRELAAWRERTALELNSPPSWLIPDGAMVDACKRRMRSSGELRSLRGVHPSSVREHGDGMVGAIARGLKQPAEPLPRPTPLSPKQQLYASLVHVVVKALGEDAGIAARFLGNKSDCEHLVRGYSAHTELGRLMDGWRAEFVGNTAIAWLRGDVALRTDSERNSGIHLVGI